MTITNGYATLDEVKHINVTNLSTTASDDILETVIESISRSIENYCGRRFWSASETRYYTAEQSWIIPVDDISATSSITLETDDDGDRTYENTWASTDYELRPYNATFNGLPFTSIEITPMGNYRFPRVAKGIKLTATFGWSATPKPVNRACVLQSVRLFKRYITPLGVSASSAIGEIKLMIPALDPDVTMLLRPYIRYEL